MLRNYFLINLILITIIGLLGQKLYRVSTMRLNVPVSAQARVPEKIKKDIAKKEKIMDVSYDIITKNNLFHPSRSSTKKTVKTSAKPVSPKDTPQLFGTIITGDKKIAILEDPSTKKSGSYNVNDSIAGFVVSEILEEKVILKRGGETVELGLRADKKFKAPKRIQSRPKTLRKRPKHRRSPERRRPRRIPRRERRR